MNCRKILAKLSDYIDREADSQETKKMNSHFASCPMCMAFLNTLKKTIDIFKRKGHDEIPDDLSRSMRERIKGEMGKDA